ncbi:MAG: sulfatase family protein [Coraliomargarita sp.]
MDQTEAAGEEEIYEEAITMKRTIYLAVVGLCMACSVHATEKPNVVFVTFDDLSRSSLGLYGSTVPEITPHMDGLGVAGLRFMHAHVSAPNCTPSRNSMMSGMYPHNSKVMTISGDGSGNQARMTTIPLVFRAAGYHTGIMGKNSHMSPFEPYSGWDKEYGGYFSANVPGDVYQMTQAAFSTAKKLGQPLYLNINSYDPHVGWYGWNHNAQTIKEEKSNHPSRIYTADEVPYPSWLPKLNEAEMTGEKGTTVMDGVAAYYNSVKRADDTLGQAIRAIKEAGEWDNTIIVMMSDHGSEFPASKTMLYFESTCVPFFVRWPGVTQADTVDDRHVISSVDLLPTFCEIAGQPIPANLDGRSLVPIIKGETSSDWPKHMYKEHNVHHISRAVQTADYLYIYNPWSDGKMTPKSVTMGHLTWEAIDKAGLSEMNPEARLWRKKFLYRTVEELYHTGDDPDCKTDLFNNPKYADKLAEMRQLMEYEMRRSGDTALLDAFLNRSDKSTWDKLRSLTGRRLNSMRMNPMHARDVSFDPLDDHVVIDFAHFKGPQGWGIWKAEDKHVALTKKPGKGKAKISGLEFKADARVISSRKINLRGLSTLQLDTAIDARNVSKDCRLQFQYYDGDGWKDLGSLNPNTPELPLVMKNVPQKPVLLGIQCKAVGKGSVFLQYLRLSGWEAWKTQRAEQFENPLALKSVGASVSFGPAFNAAKLGVIRVEFLFQGSGSTADDTLELEYFDGSDWKLVKQYVVNQSNQRFVGSVDLHDEQFAFSPKFSLRLRKTKGTGTVSVDAVTLKTRSNQLGSGLN